MYSNRYIFIYSSIMVIIVAAILSSAAMFLKPIQDKNMATAKMQGILAAADITATSIDAEELYAKYITEELVIDKQGHVVSAFENNAFKSGDMRAFDLDIKKELYRKSMGEDFYTPLYVAHINNELIYIVPLLGKGLWGPIYGNIAFGPDFNRIIGAEFGHDKETPGLGAEINTRDFGQQFIGKTIFNQNGEFTSINVVKGGVSDLPQNLKIHGVDAISGGTITSNGVTDMLRNCLENYVPFIKDQVVNKKPV
ncbi:MAG: NADH:ubiquinone reductase (Na(+)-transporting) subunit C [Bacteroidetes bacterium]|nr:NADH:ubiquinone reductase (Na(+)-transporting) subunit C [Bacteroidota bacterium]